MAGKTTKAKAKRVYKRRAPMRARRRNLRTNVPEKASLSQSIRVADSESNQIYGSNTFALSQFDRAVQVAKAYQEFRITSCRWTFKPQFDTFAANTDAATALRVPQFYYMIDKAQAIPLNATIATLRSMGAKPRRFDDKNVYVTYAPAVQGSVWDGGAATVPSMPRTSPWLSTNATPDGAWNPNTIDHGGLFYYLDAGVLPGDGQYEFSVELEVQFEFRKPLIPIPTGESQAKPLVLVTA